MDREQLRASLAALRRRRGLTQAELAVSAGISDSYVSLYESGRREPEPPVLERIAGALGVRLDYVLVGADVALPDDPVTRSIVAALVRHGPGLSEKRKRILRAQLEEWGMLDERE